MPRRKAAHLRASEQRGSLPALMQLSSSHRSHRGHQMNERAGERISLRRTARRFVVRPFPYQPTPCMHQLSLNLSSALQPCEHVGKVTSAAFYVFAHSSFNLLFPCDTPPSPFHHSSQLLTQSLLPSSVAPAVHCSLVAGSASPSSHSQATSTDQPAAWRDCVGGI